jgi:hypothetical protein
VDHRQGTSCCVAHVHVHVPEFSTQTTSLNTGTDTHDCSARSEDRSGSESWPASREGRQPEAIRDPRRRRALRPYRAWRQSSTKQEAADGPQGLSLASAPDRIGTETSDSSAATTTTATAEIDKKAICRRRNRLVVQQWQWRWIALDTIYVFHFFVSALCV